MNEKPKSKAWAFALLAGALLRALPLGLQPEAHGLAAIFVAVVILWVTEAIPIAMTALLIAPAMIALGVCDAKTAFAPYADPLLFLFVGGFFIARAMARHGLDRRVAAAMTQNAWVGKSESRKRLAFMGAAVLLSMWISNTATCAILIPILLGTASAESREDDVLSVAYACSVGGLGTLVGSPPNAITARLLDEHLEASGGSFGFLDWITIGLPATAILAAIVFFALRRKPSGQTEAESEPGREATPWTKGEKVCALAFGLAVAGWLVPPLLKAAEVPGGAALKSALPGGGVALIAASVLFLFPDEKGEMTLPWADAARIDWGIIMLFGGGIALGKQMVATGLASEAARAFVAATGIESLVVLTAVVAFFTIFFTEVCSNTASANILVPLVIAVSVEIEVSPVAPALAVGLAASCAFMLPIATGPNAIAYGSGQVTQRAMMRTGLKLNLLAAVAVIAIALIAGSI